MRLKAFSSIEVHSKALSFCQWNYHLGKFWYKLFVLIDCSEERAQSFEGARGWHIDNCSCAKDRYLRLVFFQVVFKVTDSVYEERSFIPINL